MEPYKKTAFFDEVTLPEALRRDHRSEQMREYILFKAIAMTGCWPPIRTRNQGLE